MVVIDQKTRIREGLVRVYKTNTCILTVRYTTPTQHLHILERARTHRP